MTSFAGQRERLARCSAAAGVTVRREIAAAAEDLFDAWLDAESLAAWMCPGGAAHAVIKLDPSPGGEFEILVDQGARGVRYGGCYRLIDRPRRLVFTWMCNSAEPSALITVDFNSGKRGKTEVVLTQEPLHGGDAEAAELLLTYKEQLAAFR